jgi:hypothetical protein
MITFSFFCSQMGQEKTQTDSGDPAKDIGIEAQVVF